MHIVILGAGAVGCFVGGCWKAAGADVSFLGRQKRADEVSKHGLRLTDLDGWGIFFEPGSLDYVCDLKILAQAELVVVTVKSTATREAINLINRHCAVDAAVLSLQNGISNVVFLRENLGGRDVLAGMVGFNVVRMAPGHWHKSTTGTLTVEEAGLTRRIAGFAKGSPLYLRLAGDMISVAWGKLLLNLNNPINALSGLPLAEQLTDRVFRKVLAATIREAYSVIGSSGIVPARITPLPPAFLAGFIDTPNWFFNTIGLRLQKVDATARSSMADDFAAGRPTEIDYLNGEIVKLAGQNGLTAPINARIVALVKQAQSGGQSTWSGKELANELGLD